MDTACDAYLRQHDAHHLDELKEFLRIPSVSSLPEHRGDVLRAGEWVATQLQRLGARDIARLPPRGNPVVYGQRPAPAGAPTAVLYGHYDVQPPDPLDLWETPLRADRPRWPPLRPRRGGRQGQPLRTPQGDRGISGRPRQ